MSSDKPPTPDAEPTIEVPKTLENENPNQESTDPSLSHKEDVDQEAEEEGECGFCLFMKGGECRETFINWEKCVEEGEKNNEDIVDKCFAATSALKKCMEAHPDYYGVILQAEKDAEQEVSNQLDQEKEHLAAAAAVSNSGEQQQKQDTQ
ncbi:uncharacterized protein LOC112525131 [Cynara cardunculus var. scolymus]|uniref:uncharacterized protein LOC112525131 n=1 Tax=Cynara cardunculus var. scolymus TaxID=59895 RepID=UPI000D62C1A6|nr:uncharacterized protein LOC112525131 [Cynara cardunculus var. scolymus]